MLGKKILGFFILFSFIVGILFYFTIDERVLENFKALNYFYLSLAVLSLIIGWYFDAYRLKILVAGLQMEVSLLVSWQVVLSNYFLGVFTPASSGGLLAQIYCLKHSGIELGASMAIVIVRTLLSIICLILFAPWILYFNFSLLKVDSHILLVLTVLLMVFISMVFILLKSNNPLLSKLQWLSKLKEYIVKIFKALLFYKDKGYKNLFKAFFYSGISLFFLYLSVPFLILAFGVYPHFISVLGRVALVNLLLYLAPTPGGAGIAEGSMTLALQGLIPFYLTGVISILWRFLSEYLPCLLGAIICFPILQDKLRGGR